MRLSLATSLSLFGTCLCTETFLKQLPSAFQKSSVKWAWVSYDSPSVAVIPGSFNRSVFDAPHEGEVSDKGVKQAYVETHRLSARSSFKRAIWCH